MYSPPKGYRTLQRVYAQSGYGSNYLPARIGRNHCVLPAGGSVAIYNPIPGLSPSAWFSGDSQAYSDIAGTVPAVIGGPVGNLAEPSPLSSSFQAASNGQRGLRDSNSVSLYYYGAALPGQTYARAVNPNPVTNAVTFVYSFMPRDGVQGPPSGLFRMPSPTLGLWGAGQIFISSTAGNWFTGVFYNKAVKTTIGIVYAPTVITLYVLAANVLTIYTFAASLDVEAQIGSLTLGDSFGGAQGLYGAVSQAVLFNRSLNASDITSVMNWTHSRPLPPAYPLDAPLIGIIGDSIPRGATGCMAISAWCWQSLKYVKSGLFPKAEMANCAIAGDGAGLSNCSTLLPFYSPSRAKNVAILQVGTNNLAQGNDTTATLTALYAECDAVRARGFKLGLSTILPRSGLLGAGVTQAQFNAQAAIYNASILSAGAAHSDLLINTQTIAGMGAVGDSANPLNYSADQVHPIDNGMNLLYPTYRNATIALLAL